MIQNVQKGNPSSFEQLFSIYAGKAYGVCLRLSGSLKIAEELTIKSFLNAWENISFIRYDTPFSGWITGITINNFLHFILANDLSSKTGEEIPGNYLKSRLEESIIRLPHQQRYIIIFHLVEHYSLEESSDFLGLSYTDTRLLFQESLKSLLEAFDNVYTTEQLIEKIESLPDRIAPPPSVWTEIEKNIQQQKTKSFEESEKSKIAQQQARNNDENKPEPEKHKISKKGKGYKSKFAVTKKSKKILAASLAVVLLALFYYFFFYNNVHWELAGSTSTVFINGEAAFAGSIIDDGETIFSPGSSGFSVINSSIGKVQAASNASFKTIDDSSLNFISGTFRIFKVNANQCFRAVVPSAVIKDEMSVGYYEIEINRDENTILRNGSCKLFITSGETEFFIPPGYDCHITKSFGAGIPYHNASSEQFKKALNDPHLSKDEIADAILTIAQKRDVFTVWNMIKLVSPMKRAELFDFISKHIQIPPSVSKDGIVFLKKNMLDELRKLL